MSTALTNEYNLESNLWRLLTEVRSDGRAVEHFVCLDCTELAEKPADTEGAIHECPPASLLRPPPLGQTPAPSSSSLTSLI